MRGENSKPLLGIIAIIAVSLIAALSFALLALPSQTIIPGQSDSINYRADVCVYKNGELIQCDHNLLYNSGKDQIKQVLGTGVSAGAITNIALCNASLGCGTPAAAADEAFTAYNLCGLANATGTYASNGVGNWSVTKTFTSTCDNVLTNATRIMNSSASPFAGNTFTLVTLQTNDQLTINWTISVS